jgi:hypothetical protein
LIVVGIKGNLKTYAQAVGTAQGAGEQENAAYNFIHNGKL